MILSPETVLLTLETDSIFGVKEKCDGKEKLIMTSFGAEALMRIARANVFGHPGVNVNVPKAFEIYKMSAHLGDPDAHFELSMAYMNGDDGAGQAMKFRRTQRSQYCTSRRRLRLVDVNFMGTLKLLYQKTA